MVQLEDLFADNVDKDQTAQNMQSDLGSTMSGKGIFQIQQDKD